jgi:hypothetical protein
MLRRYARQQFLFEALTFCNRTSIQCNRRAQFWKISYPYRNFSVGGGFGKISAIFFPPCRKAVKEVARIIKDVIFSAEKDGY